MTVLVKVSWMCLICNILIWNLLLKKQRVIQFLDVEIKIFDIGFEHALYRIK